MKTYPKPENKAKKLAIRLGISSVVLILFFSMLLLGLFTAHKQSRDNIRLADIGSLRAELERFYYVYNKFPKAILDKHQLKYPDEQCVGNLCLDGVPHDPKTSMFYKYTPCADLDAKECTNDVEQAQNYRLEYLIESGGAEVGPGVHYATAFSLY